MSDKTLYAPEFPDTLEWINTEKPLQMSALRGKIIVLEFWTAGSIACLHMHDKLRYLQNKYREHLLVVGIHSPKFPHDKQLENARSSVNRLHIKYPVAHDSIKRMCVKYGIKAWPSIIMIDAAGCIIGRLQGECDRRDLDQLLKQYITAAEQKGLLNSAPIAVKSTMEAPAVLSFPAKLFASTPSTYISDSGHNRILEINQHGRVTRVFGSGGAGLLDGNGRDAAFNNPQGLAVVSNFLYVADCGNHAIRRIDLQSQDIQTVAGTGTIGKQRTGSFHEPTAIELNSPRDVYYDDGVLYIAMAGQHQIWQLRLTDNVLSVLAGSGRIGLQDGRMEDASFAQPCAIVIDDYRIYVCDAESSAIRLVRKTGSQVSTLIGKGLSVFGDKDSGWSKALLQHPQALAIDAGRQLIYVADSYNNKIKVMDLNLQSISTLDAGGGLDEPDGLSLCENTLWIANTNAHEIRKVNLLTQEVEVVALNEPEQDF